MIFTNDFFRATKLPLFLEKTTEMMRKANRMLFASEKDMERFCEMLKKQLNEDKPKNSTAYVYFHKADREDSGCIYIYLKEMSDKSVLRLYYYVVDGALEYDEHAGDYFEINERLESIFEKGG